MVKKNLFVAAVIISTTIMTSSALATEYFIRPDLLPQQKYELNKPVTSLEQENKITEPCQNCQPTPLDENNVPVINTSSENVPTFQVPGETKLIKQFDNNTPAKTNVVDFSNTKAKEQKIPNCNDLKNPEAFSQFDSSESAIDKWYPTKVTDKDALQLKSYFDNVDKVVGLTHDQKMMVSDIKQDAMDDIVAIKKEIAKKQSELLSMQSLQGQNVDIAKSSQPIEKEIAVLQKRLSNVFKDTEKKYMKILDRDQRKLYNECKVMH